VTKSHDRLRILFVALAQSTHTHSWVSLLDAREFDLRIFGVQRTRPPRGFPIPTVSLSSRGEWLQARGTRYLGARVRWLEERLLAQLLKEWKPHIVHTLGLEPAAFFYRAVRKSVPSLPPTTWVVTVRGGPELMLNRNLPEAAGRIRDVLEHCDQFIADNDFNYGVARELGLAPEKAAPMGRTPGGGGVDIAELRAMRTQPASRSRLILIPKAYECPASKVLPVFEALKLCWSDIQPCEVHFTAAIPEALLWFAALPQEVRSRCMVHGRLPRREFLALMGRARIMLAPSLTDGVPNVLYEAMASGCLPIVSPIETLTNLVADGANVLYARNLYPHEIASALVRAMSDDQLVDEMVTRNTALVARLADRTKVAEAVADNYRTLGSKGRPVR